jgi:hypothetical protein
MNINELLATKGSTFSELEQGMRQMLAAPAKARLGPLRSAASPALAAPAGPEADRELKKKLLEKSLRVAIRLEQATIPPYLCALWSIEDELHPAAKSIREVVQEEMLHMSLACNMLVAIGGTPDLLSQCPSYPSPLPGGLHPQLKVRLAGLSPEILDDFMVIERPEKVIPHGHTENPTTIESTIGSFYLSLEALFRDVSPTFHTESQITGPIAKLVIKDLDDVTAAIATIREQGEGSSSTMADTGIDDLAHYYRFEELREGRKLEFDETKDPPFFHGAELVFPQVLPMQSVPDGGYQKEDVPHEAWELITRFDWAYSQMLQYLNAAWTGGGQRAFLKSIECMFELEKTAKPLMRIPLPANPSVTLGPCFRYTPETTIS